MTLVRGLDLGVTVFVQISLDLQVEDRLGIFEYAIAGARYSVLPDRGRRLSGPRRRPECRRLSGS